MKKQVKIKITDQKIAQYNGFGPGLYYSIDQNCRFSHKRVPILDYKQDVFVIGSVESAIKENLKLVMVTPIKWEHRKALYYLGYLITPDLAYLDPFQLLCTEV